MLMVLLSVINQGLPNASYFTSSLLAACHPISLFVWSDFFRYSWAEYNGGIFVFAENDDGMFTIRATALKHEHIRWCFDVMAEHNGSSNVARIEHLTQSECAQIDESRYRIDKRPCEYVYWRDDIAQLKGNAYKSRRHDLNQFLMRHHGHYREYQNRDFDACLDLFDRWAESRRKTSEDVIYHAMLDENRRVHQRLLRHAQILALDVRVVEVDHKVEAYTAGFPLTDDMYCIYLEVANVSLIGLPVFVFHKFCQDNELKPYRFVNCMDDFAMDNGKRTKMSYRPALLLASYSIAAKE